VNTLRIDASSLADSQREVSPASVLLDVTAEFTVLAAGEPGEVDRHPRARGARRMDRAGCTIIPGLVNAHAHLDLTHAGPLPFDPAGGFSGWIDRVRRSRLTGDSEIADSVTRGAKMCLAGGVVAVGDIAGAVRGQPSLQASRALLATDLKGTSFVEFFAWPPREADVLDLVSMLPSQWDGRGRVRLGLQPHAPYSVSIRGYGLAQVMGRDFDLPVCTHLAESVEEARFIASHEGVFVEFMRGLGLQTGGGQRPPGAGRTPVAHLEPVLHERPMAVVHLNQLSDADIAILSASGSTAVYCPRASDYFGAPAAMGPHRYRDLLDARVPVALGTDSIINLPEGTTRLSPWDEMVYLFARDGTDPRTLLAMATVHGARAIGFDPTHFALRVGAKTDALCVLTSDSLAGALGAGADLAVIRP
jgi:cytosine/adenosine deaminase-related metal-dependent hydrolase